MPDTTRAADGDGSLLGWLSCAGNLVLSGRPESGSPEGKYSIDKCKQAITLDV